MKMKTVYFNEMHNLVVELKKNNKKIEVYQHLGLRGFKICSIHGTGSSDPGGA